MKKRIIAFISMGSLAALSVFVLLNFGAASKAESISFAQRFDANVGIENLTVEENSGSYSMDGAHSYIGFRVMHMGLAEVPGSFNDFTGTIKYDSKNVNKSSVEFSAKTASVDTRVARRDNHLRSADFFEAKKYPTMTFKSTKVEKAGDKLKVTGDLTIKNVTKKVTILFVIYGPIKDRRGNIKMGVQGSTSINRRDFTVNYGTDAIISNKIKIDLQLESGKQKATAK